MGLRELIRENRPAIDAAIHSVPGAESLRLNDEDRAEWVRNDEGLYSWARSHGVRL